jgi:hypothetical protein
MADGPVEVVYSVDTNSFMDWQARYYPTDVFKSLDAELNALVGAGRLRAAALVREELDAVGTPELTGWARANAGIFVPTPDLLADALVIQNQFPGLRDPKAEYEEADAFVIALARLRNGIVVTQETPAAEKSRPRRTHFIPDVCRELGVPCISLLGLMRREKWAL